MSGILILKMDEAVRGRAIFGAATCQEEVLEDYAAICN